MMVHPIAPRRSGESGAHVDINWDEAVSGLSIASTAVSTIAMASSRW
jgi:hypothetical protein